MGSLSNLYISQSFTSLLHLGNDGPVTDLAPGEYTQFQDGLGNSLGISVNSSGDISSSGYIYATNIFPTITTASFNQYTQSTNIRLTNIETTTASLNSSVSQLNASSASQQVSINALNTFTASQSTASIVNSITNLNNFTSSANGRLNNLESTTASLNSSVSQLNASSASQQISINALNAATASYATNTNLTNLSASLTVTDNFLQAQIDALDVSGSAASVAALNAFTASQLNINSGYNTFSASTLVSISNLNITTASLNTSISNINTFTQSAQISINALNTNSASVNTSITNINSATASLFTSASLALVTASFSGNTLTFTKGDASTFGVVIPDVSGSTLPSGVISGSAQITSLGFVSSSITASSIITASVNNDNITFTKGDGSQFTIQVATGSFAISASYAETASIARNLVITARNGNPSTLPIGTVVHITSAVGDNPIFNTASYDTELLSANTLGVLRQAAVSGTDVEVVVQGKVVGVNTDPALGYAAGDVIYLSSSGQFTRVQPQAPNQIVVLGQVLRAQQNNGSIYVSINNGWELNELHNVQINGVQTGDLLQYESSSYGLWKNKSIVGAGITTTSSFNSYTSSNDQKVNSLIAATGSYATTGSNSFNGSQTITGSITTTQDITISGVKFGFGNPAGTSSIAIGFNALANNTGTNNIAIGVSAGQLNTTGGSNTIIGQNAAVSISSGSSNTIIGQAAGAEVRGGSGNTFIGQTSGYNTSGSNNTFIGAYRGIGNENGVIALSDGGQNLRAIYNSGWVFTGSVDIQNTLTASLQEGYVWVGNSAGRTVTVATSSFGSTINTGSFATTGSNTFIGNQIVTGNVTISGSAQSDLTVVGQIFVSSSATGGTTAPRITVSGSAGTTTINRNNISTRNVTNQATLSPTLVYVTDLASTDEIGFSVEASSFPNWTFGPGIYVNNPADTYPAVLGFQDKANYTDGRVTVLTPLSASAGFTASLQNGYAWVGNSLGQNTQVATSSFGTAINTGSFATTGSNQFNGNQTITGSIISVDRSGNDTNTIIGLNALGMGSAGASPLAVGNTISVAIGQGAMRFASGSNQNIAIGNNALLVTTGSKNFAMGSEALSSNTTGQQNVAIGTSTLTKNTIGESNVAIGDSAGFNVSGSQNTFIGSNSGYNISGSNNTILGRYQGSAGQVLNNNIILADGNGTIKAQYSGSAWSLQDGIKLNVGTDKPADIVSVLNGNATVNNSLATTSSIILLTTQETLGGSQYPAIVDSKTNGSFDIRTNQSSTIKVAYLIINPTT